MLLPALAAVGLLAGLLEIPPRTLEGEVFLMESNVATFDPNLFAPGPNIDIYHLVLHNRTDGNVTSLGLSLPGGPYLNNSTEPLTFRNTTNLPRLSMNRVAESFFVIPSPFLASDVLSVETLDTSSVLRSSYTLTGGPTLIGPQGSIVAAVLSVPTGTVLDTSNWTGFSGIPEPTAALLAACGFAAAATRRR